MNKVVDYIVHNLDIGEEYERIFGRSLPPKKCFCPFHPNSNTPAAARYNNVIHCFVCNKNYTTYDLLKKYDPKRIEEIKASVQIEDVDNSISVRVKILSNIDRSRPISQIVSFILMNQ